MLWKGAQEKWTKRNIPSRLFHSDDDICDEKIIANLQHRTKEQKNLVYKVYSGNNSGKKANILILIIHPTDAILMKNSISC